MTGKTVKTVKAVAMERDVPFSVAAHLSGDEEIAGYLEAILEDGDPRVITTGLRHVAEAIGGMAALATKTGLSRETLYRTLSDRGNPRLDTLSAILAVFGLRLSVRPASRVA